MKFLIMSIALAVGIFYALVPGVDKPRPKWWTLSAFLIMTSSLFLTLYPPITARVSDLDLIKEYRAGQVLPFELDIQSDSFKWNETNNQWEYKIGENTIVYNSKSNTIAEELKINNSFIIDMKYQKESNSFLMLGEIQSIPFITYPYLLEFEERIRILNLHVPLSWVAVLAYLVSMIFSVKYLKKRDLRYDIKSSAAASLGLLFTILATTTGMVWAQYNWGTYWNWDPRQTSIFVLMLIYAAYFVLRSALPNEEVKARLSSVYSIFAFFTVPLFVFILPRLAAGLHPGSADDSSAGPLVSSSQGMLNAEMSYAFGLALAAFTILFFWILNLQIRIKYLNKGLK